MKRSLLYMMLVVIMTTGCTEAFDNISGAEKVKSISLNVNLNLDLEILVDYEMYLRFINYDEGLEYKFPVTDDNIIARSAGGLGNITVKVTGLVPGIYTVLLSGKGLTNDEEFDYLLSGSLVNEPLSEDEQSIEVKIQGGKKGALILKELYYCGVPSYYFRDNYYELYNNSDATIYLDGVHFAHLNPAAATTTLPVWPTEDGDNYVYAVRVWRFPGSGTDYPLEPGESVVLAQHAINHTATNDKSPVDLTSSEFEFYMNSSTFADQPAFNMEHVFYEGKSDIGSLEFYMTSVFGGAYVLFRIPEGENWDPVNDPNMHTVDLSSKYATLYAKIPIDYVLDGVECGDNASMVNAKRMPGILDAGMTWVGDFYCGLSVTRRIELDESGNEVTLKNGSYKYADTNNSTDDFEAGIEPELRRHGAKMPLWNHTLQ